MDEAKKEEIKKEAREILKKFSKVIGKASLKEKELKREIGGFRKENEPLPGDSDFRERMFANASSKEGDCIIAEKKKWQ
jgi:hypothetical protein